jgi:phosphatidate cytidylyltransferase
MAWLGAAWLPSLSPGARIALGVVLVAVGILGDLLESAVKRAAAVKDSSDLIPGHGGVLDRIDALLLVIPVYGVALSAASRWGL